MDILTGFMKAENRDRINDLTIVNCMCIIENSFAMSEGFDFTRRDSIASMKQWLLTKFKAQNDDNRQPPPRVSRQDSRSRSGAVPTIVISEGSQRNINSMSPGSSPITKQPGLLVKSWMHYDMQSNVPLKSPSLGSSRSLWESVSFVSHPNTTFLNEHIQVAAVPSALNHIQQSGTNSYARATPPGSRPAMQILSPLQRFQQRHTLPYQFTEIRGLTPPTSVFSSRSELDSESICGECGQHKFYGSQDLVGFEGEHLPPLYAHRPEVNRPEPINSPKLKHRQLGQDRITNYRRINTLERQIFNNSGTSTKSSSHMDVQKSPPAKLQRVKSARSSNKSTATLSRSWSKYLDSFRHSRNESVTFRNADRRLSLNFNDMRRVKQERRRSSLSRLLCHDITDSDDDNRIEDDVSATESASGETILNCSTPCSPQVTRSTNVLNVDPLDDFKSTFDDSDGVNIPSMYGQIKVMFQYINEKTEFHVTILKGIQVAPSQKGMLGVYVKVCLMPGKMQMKMGDDKHNTRNPVFYEPFTFKVGLDELLDRQLRIKLYNKTGVFSFAEAIGKCKVDLYQYDLTAVTVIWQNLKKCNRQRVGVFL